MSTIKRGKAVCSGRLLAKERFEQAVVERIQQHVLTVERVTEYIRAYNEQARRETAVKLEDVACLDRTLAEEPVARFASVVGAGNLVSYDPFDPEALRRAMELTTGVSRLPSVDFANARYLLSFNAHDFETFLSPVRFIHSYCQLRQGRPGIRGKFVHAEPRLSQTAACADEWLAIRPGTEGLLALAMAHVIVAEKLYDASAVQNATGFAEWSAALANYAAKPPLNAFDPEALDAYVRFVREKTLLEAIASSLTELFSPQIITERVEGMLASYPFVTRQTLAYFDKRPPQAKKDSDFALGYCKDNARTPEQQQQVLAALEFKCSILWAMCDALQHAYVDPKEIPPGAFTPGPAQWRDLPQIQPRRVLVTFPSARAGLERPVQRRTLRTARSGAGFYQWCSGTSWRDPFRPVVDCRFTHLYFHPADPADGRAGSAALFVFHLENAR